MAITVSVGSVWPGGKLMLLPGQSILPPQSFVSLDHLAYLVTMSSLEQGLPFPVSFLKLFFIYSVEGSRLLITKHFIRTKYMKYIQNPAENLSIISLSKA